MTNDTTNTKTHAGSCHCGDIRFEVELDASSGTHCNCTICTKTAILGAIVKPSAFKLLSSTDKSTYYEWGGKVAKRYFCKTCGIHVYGSGFLEQIGGDFVSINMHCIDGLDPAQVKKGYWDGRHNNWMAGMRDKPWPIEAQNGS